MTQRTDAMKLEGVHHTARPTWKLRETVEFYRDILGLPLVHTISARGWGREGHPDFLHFFFDSGKGSSIAFFYYIGTERPEYLTPRTEEFFYRATHTAWQVETRAELNAWRERPEKRGIEVSPDTRHEVIESIYFTDPNGYPIKITLPLRPFGELDARDAALTLEAAIQLEDANRSGEQELVEIDGVWRVKGTLVERLSSARA
jgi:catechol 2,3-dioxygenase-like lactoylglutathione lyase family enzyme